MNREFTSPKVPPPISEWRRNILRICAEDRVADRIARRNAPQQKPRCHEQPKREPRPEPTPRAPRKPKMRTLCSCGRNILTADALQCTWCRQHPCKTAAGRTCSMCPAKIIRTNNTGLCKKHGNLYARKRREDRKLGDRPVCKHQADGMRCTQQLYRDNRTGLCCWHNGVKQPLASKYRTTQPIMEPING